MIYTNANPYKNENRAICRPSNLRRRYPVNRNNCFPGLGCRENPQPCRNIGRVYLLTPTNQIPPYKMEARKRKTRIRQNPEVKNIESGISFYQTQIDTYNKIIDGMVKRRDEFQANIDQMKSDLSKIKHYETV